MCIAAVWYTYEVILYSFLDFIAITASPRIIEHPKPKICRRDDAAKEVMNCSATGMAPIFYRWEKYQPFSHSWIRPSDRVNNVTSPKLTFTVITEEDEGIYHCVVTNDDGSVISNNATLTVYGKYMR